MLYVVTAMLIECFIPDESTYYLRMPVQHSMCRICTMCVSFADGLPVLLQIMNISAVCLLFVVIQWQRDINVRNADNPLLSIRGIFMHVSHSDTYAYTT